ncbi:MAG: NADH-quinone oxidoreductase subunit C, partial [Eggerthellaceae bacterium]|nr:NADH-quinone oxidoreductase subunit C [Eggerthellaceae bacterium]
IEGNVLDFKGNFYKFPEGIEAPMTIISPEQLAAREKAAKIAAAKAAREAKAKAAKEGQDTAPSQAFDETSQAQKEAELEAKLAGMDPEKAAKVRAAMEAKAKRAAKAQTTTETSEEGE